MVIAELQNIVYSEFLPVVLGSNLMKLHNLNLPEEGSTVYDEEVNPTISNEFATFAFRFGHTLIPNFIRYYEKWIHFLINFKILGQKESPTDQVQTFVQ